MLTHHPLPDGGSRCHEKKNSEKYRSVQLRNACLCKSRHVEYCTDRLGGLVSSPAPRHQPLTFRREKHSRGEQITNVESLERVEERHESWQQPSPVFDISIEFRPRRSRWMKARRRMIIVPSSTCSIYVRLTTVTLFQFYGYYYVIIPTM